MQLTITKANKIQGQVVVPGDKSISHRALILGSLAHGETLVSNFLGAADTLSTLNCLKELGVEINPLKDKLLVKGVGKRGFRQPAKLLNAGNSGTTIRILPAILAAQPFSSEIAGDASLNKRPMERITKPLSLMGAKIKSASGFPPLVIEGDYLKGITYELPVASAQVKSAVLIAGLLAEGKTEVIEPVKSRDHTERMISYLGADIEQNGNTLVIHGTSELTALPIDIPGDISSAAFFIATSLLVSNSFLRIKKVGVNPTRGGFLQVVKKMGANFDFDNEQMKNNEPIADINVKASSLSATKISGSLIPLLIDEIPTVAVLATQADGRTVISDASELRVKETDRIAALASELRKLGAQLEEKEDGLVIDGPVKLKGCQVESYSDHRMAMALAVAGLVAEGQTVINGAECIGVSFPGFKELLISIAK